MNLWRTIQLGKETDQHGVAEGPGLIFVVADVFDFQTDFFHDFAANSLFQSFTEFGVAGDQGVAGVFTAGVFGEKKLVSVGDGYNDGWGDLRVDGIATRGTDHCPLFFAFHGGCATAAAETAAAVKTVKLCAVGRSKGNPERF